MRNIAIADPSEWVSRQVPNRPQPPRSRLTDWLATLPIVLLLPALLVLALPLLATVWPQLSLSPSTAAPGTTIAVSGSGFDKGVQGFLLWDGERGDLPRFKVNGQGAFRASFIVPTDATPGDHRVSAVVDRGTPGKGKQAQAAPAIDSSEVASAIVVVLEESPPASPSPASIPPPALPSDPPAAPTTEPSPVEPSATPSADATPPATPDVVATPTLAPTPQPSPTAQPAPGCARLQLLVDAASAGSTITVPPCIYRETVTVGKPLTLAAQPGAEIRGSDVWTDWSSSGSKWVSNASVPAFPAHGYCRPGTDRCLRPDQVFLDGSALLQVASDPASGQFAVDSLRRIVLADSPAGHLVEVTTRTRWVAVTADSVVIQGFRMRHAANDAQSGGITDGGRTITVRDNVLSDAHGAVVSLSGRGALIGNDIFRGGQLGVHKGGALVQGNRIHDNNTEDFDPGWEAGGLKAVTSNQTVEGNEVYGNGGPGLWWDIGSTGITVRRNQVYGNEQMGIFYEISGGGTIIENAVWDNGWAKPAWGWGAGILLSSSRETEVRGNIVAWNADGISVISQNRSDAPGPVTGINVHDNVVALAPRSSDTSDKPMLGWMQDWSGVLFDLGSNNRGSGNRYWHAQAEPSSCRFAWAGCRSTILEFNAGPGEEGARYLTQAERDEILDAAAIPGAP